MEQILVLNIVALFVLFFAGLFFGREEGRAFSAGWLFAFGFGISIWGWLIYVAVHFISKYW